MLLLQRLRAWSPVRSEDSISGLLYNAIALSVWTRTNSGKFFKRWEYQTNWPASWEICIQVRKQQLELPKWPCVHRCKTYLPVAALPQWELSMKVQLLGFWGPWQCQVCRDTDCLCCRSYRPVRVFFQASCSRPSEGLLGQSFCVALPIQAWGPCLGSFSVQWVRHKEGHP